MHTLSAPTPVDTSAPADRPRLGRASLPASAIAVAAVTITWLVADAATGGLIVDQGGGPEQVGLLPAVGATLLGSRVGVALAWLVRRFAARPRRTFVATCAVGFAAYASTPFLVAEGLDTALWLNALHVVAAVPIVGGLARLLPGEARTLR